jgi:hypothetical protein
MDDTLKSKILELLDQHRLMTVATNRPDGWPQATTVGYVNERADALFLMQSSKPKSGKPRAGWQGFTDHRSRCHRPNGDHGPFDGSPGAASYRPDRSGEGREIASDEIPRIRGVPDAETGGNRFLSCASKGDFRPRLFERVWTCRSCYGLADRASLEPGDRVHTVPTACDTWRGGT